MKLFTNLLLLACVALLASCQTNKNGQALPEGCLRVLPDTITVLDNPLSGWVAYGSENMPDDFWEQNDHIAVPAKDTTVRISDYAKTFYVRVHWSTMNPAEGVYFWNTDCKLRRVVQGALDRGMRLAFRVIVDSRDRAREATPAYVFDAGASYYTNRGLRSPYPDDPVFQAKYEAFLDAFAKQYNAPEQVEFIDGYGLGKWGEGHTMIYRDEKNREAVFNWIIDLYVKHFTRVPLFINYHRWIGADKDWVNDKVYNPESERLLDSACEKGFSLRHDAFGMREYYGSWERAFVKKWIMKRPVILEGGWIVGKHNFRLDPSGYQTAYDVREGEFEDGREAHVNMMDFRVGDETRSWFRDAYPLVERFIAEGGYRLCPDSLVLPSNIKSGEDFTIAHRWINLGWGYCPTNIPQWQDKYKVDFALLDKDTDEVVALYSDEQARPCDWIKGTPTSYVFSGKAGEVKPGKYEWAIGIVDTTRENAIGLRLAAQGDFTASGWLKLQEVTVQN